MNLASVMTQVNTDEQIQRVLAELQIELEQAMEPYVSRQSIEATRMMFTDRIQDTFYPTNTLEEIRFHLSLEDVE